MTKHQAEWALTECNRQVLPEHRNLLYAVMHRFGFFLAVRPAAAGPELDVVAWDVLMPPDDIIVKFRAV